MKTVGKIKKLVLLIVVTASSFYSFGQSDDVAMKEIMDHRKKQESEFKDKNKSPLDKKDFKKFKGLKYYPIDLKYRVHAKFIKNEAPVLFKMKTTTDRLPEYVKYGEVHFTLDGVDHTLEVYQNLELAKRKGFENYLFIPFTDETNGHETYDVGRYIEFSIPNQEDVIVDFNQCYNPYCSYSSRYSCPIPPEVNYLSIEVKAGEKKYKDSH